MKTSTVILLVVGLGVVGFIAWRTLGRPAQEKKAPPVSGAASGPAAGPGVVNPQPASYGSKLTNTIGNVLNLTKSGLEVYQGFRGSK